MIIWFSNGQRILDCKEIKPANPKENQPWIFIGRTDAEAEAPILWPPDVKSLTHWKRHWRWASLKAGGEGDDRGLDGWMASPTQCTWIWATSGSWWWTGKPGVLQSMGSQRVRHDSATEQQQQLLYAAMTMSGESLVHQPPLWNISPQFHPLPFQSSTTFFSLRI